jgi:hypothetical protein
MACVQPNRTGVLPDAGRDAAPEAAAEAAPEATPPDDVSDGASADAAPTECTPRAVGCADTRSVRTCSAEGRWTVTSTCPAATACSAGACLCPGECADDPVVETATAGLVDDLVGGGRFLYLAVNGPQGNIRRFDLATKMETVVKSAGSGLTDIGVFALHGDEMGNLLWCSDVTNGATRTGQLMSGNVELDSNPCTHVRRHGEFVYFKSDVLYRKTLESGSLRETITREAMESFEIAGDDLYFIGELNQEAFL